jgi:hypothetical protein
VISFEKHIESFDPISLNEMDSVALMNRVDTKYLVSTAVGADFLESIKNEYSALTIDDKRLFKYRTVYFDTPEKQMLHEHLRGKLNREKVRSREYVGTDSRFLEVKFKTNKGRTVKTRIRKSGQLESIEDSEQPFLTKESAYADQDLSPVIAVLFNRVTLVGKALKERITLDFGLTFRSDEGTKEIDNLVIVEMKRDSQHSLDSVTAQNLKALSAYPSSLSKYCIGMILLNETGKYNRYKPKLLKLNKLSEHGNIW